MLTFRDYMESSLYSPTEGFYPNRALREDFYTAPELHPAFAETLAAEIAARLLQLEAAAPQEPLAVVEAGSGSGLLARQILESLRRSRPELLRRTRYVLIERVAPLLRESLRQLRADFPEVDGFSSLREIEKFSGVLFSNELIDAMPVHVLEKKNGAIHEVYVDLPDAGEPRPIVGKLSREELAPAAVAVEAGLPEGGRHSVNLEISDWYREAAAVLRRGFMLTIDYGKRFDPSAPNPPRYFYRHTTGSEVLARAGRQDLTASVDFAALEREGARRGLRTLQFCSLGQFLLERGILDQLPSGPTLEDYRRRNQIKTLFHPEGMGDVFKVLIQEKTP